MKTKKVTKLTAGKRYLLVDKEGYFSDHERNKDLFMEHSVAGCYTVNVDGDGDGWNWCGLVDDILIGMDGDEIKFFEEVIEECVIEKGEDDVLKESPSTSLQYNGAKRTITSGEITLDFFCGESIDDTGKILAQLMVGEYTIQEAYTLLKQIEMDALKMGLTS